MNVTHCSRILAFVVLTLLSPVALGARAEGDPGPAPEVIPPESGWNTYADKDRGFRIRYPAGLLVVPREQGCVQFRHRIDHEHPDPCDFTDSVRILSELIDFSITLQLHPRGLGETVRATQTDFVVSRYLQGDALAVEAGFIDRARVGTMRGYRITTGVEGCGRYSYYFPLNDTLTLYVERDFVTELDPILRDHQVFLALPGVIPPAVASELFERMLASFEAH